MKTVTEIARAAGVTYRNVYDVIKENNLVPVDYTGGKRFYTKQQEDFIYKTLYFCRLTNFITFESKINK